MDPQLHSLFGNHEFGFLTRFFYDNGFGDDGSVADGGTKSVVIIIVLLAF